MLEDHAALVAVTAHEVAHARLHRDDVHDRKYDEELTDLTAIFFGFGYFTLRSCERTFYCESGMVIHRKLGYLRFADVAHTMGLLAWLRGEQERHWVKTFPARAQGQIFHVIRYLDKTNDSASANRFSCSPCRRRTKRTCADFFATRSGAKTMNTLRRSNGH